MLLKLRLQRQSSHLSDLWVTLADANEDGQVDAELVYVLHLEGLQLLVYHLLNLVVGAEALLDQLIDF